MQVSFTAESRFPSYWNCGFQAPKLRCKTIRNTHREHHFPNPTFFVDDGVSGVTYDRPGFQAMLVEIEAGRVAAIYVDASDKSSGKRVQHIHIKYDGLDFIPLNELMKEETA